MILLLGAMQWAHAVQSLPFSLGAPFVATRPLELAPGDRQWLEQRGTLRVGIPIADNEPVDITTDRNRYQGISADYLGLVSRQLDMPVRVLGFTQREDAINALRQGRIDILASAGSFERGKPGLLFSRAYMPDRAVVVGQAHGEADRQGLAGRKIVLLDDYADTQSVQRAYPDSHVVLAPNLFSAMQALAQEEVDAFIGNELVVRSWLAMRAYLNLQVLSVSRLPASGIAFAMRGDDLRLHALVEQALDSLAPSVGHEVLGRWSVGLDADPAGQRIALSSLERLWAARHPHVVVAATQHPPYIYRDSQGQWVGLNVDLLARITRMTGLQFVYQETPSTQASLEQLGSGQADMNTTLAENAGRKQFLDFTYSFGGNHWVFVVRADGPSPASLSELSGRVLALPARHALEDEIRHAHPGIRLRLVDTYDQARELVQSGLADATIQNEAGAYLFAPGRLKVGRSVDGKWSPDRFSVVKSQPELLGILNKALEAFPVGEMRAIRMKWLSANLPQPALWSRIPPWLVWSVVLALLLGLASLVWYNRLSVQVRQRRAAEARLDDQLQWRQTLLDAIPVPVYVRDRQGRLVACNRSYEACFDISVEHLLGRRLIDVDLLPRALAEQVHADYLNLLESRQALSVERNVERAGKRLRVRQWAVPFFAGDGQLQGLLGGWTEMSGQAQLAQVTQALDALQNGLRDELRGSLQALDALLGRECGQAAMACQACDETVRQAARRCARLITVIDTCLEQASAEPPVLSLKKR